MRKRRTYEEYLDEFNKIHHNKYIYKLPFTFKNQHDYIEFYCPICKVWRKTIVQSHLRGVNCIGCANRKMRLNKSKGKEEFIKECNDLYGTELYDYSEFDYINYDTRGKIKCKICGNYFWQSPNKHLSGHGCHYCKSSFLERKILKLLKENNIEFETEKTFDFLKNNNSILRLDFYLPRYNIAIECQGSQHFEQNHFFESLDKTKDRDYRKLELCKENNIKILYYTDYQKSDEFLGEHLYKDLNELLKQIN